MAASEILRGLVPYGENILPTGQPSVSLGIQKGGGKEGGGELANANHLLTSPIVALLS